MSDPPLRRSVLYVPGSNARALEKARTLAADALILDLEDAVAPDAKPRARERVCEALRAGGFGRREVAVRVNGLGTPWGEDDLAAVCAAAPDAVLVPKVDSAAALQEVEARMEAAGAPGSTRLWSMLETPLGVSNAREIAGATPRQALWAIGANDLSEELRCRPEPDLPPLATARSLCLLAARACGLAILDGVYGDVRDAEGFLAACRQSRDFGFDGKTLVHPSQIGPCNEVFSPSAEDLEIARRTIAEFERARGEGRGVAVLDGRMIENLHVESARRTTALADAIAARA